jgi:sodium transport system ATP-binding protein
MQEVSALCDAIVVIASGRVVARGTPDELRRQTGHSNLEDAFVALAGLERGAHQ